ncbi:hypothetical protein Vretifemale_12621, partial [Volvox reticuliferus]
VATGDTVNTASRMESTGEPGAIHASEATYNLLRNVTTWISTGGIQVKGKGLLQTYLHIPSPPGAAASISTPSRPTSGNHRYQQTHLHHGCMANHQNGLTSQQSPYGLQGLHGQQSQGQQNVQGSNPVMSQHQHQYQQLEREMERSRDGMVKPPPVRPSVSSGGTGSIRSGAGSSTAATPASSGLIHMHIDSQRSSYADVPATTIAMASASTTVDVTVNATAIATAAATMAAVVAGGSSVCGAVDSIDAAETTDPMTTCMDLITAAAALVVPATTSGSAPQAVSSNSGPAPRSTSGGLHGPMNLFGDSEHSCEASGLRPSFGGFPKPAQVYSGDRSSTPPVTTRVGGVRTGAGRLLESALAVLNWEG